MQHQICCTICACLCVLQVYYRRRKVYVCVCCRCTTGVRRQSRSVECLVLNVASSLWHVMQNYTMMVMMMRIMTTLWSWENAGTSDIMSTLSLAKAHLVRSVYTGSFHADEWHFAVSLLHCTEWRSINWTSYSCCRSCVYFYNKTCQCDNEHCMCSNKNISQSGA